MQTLRLIEDSGGKAIFVPCDIQSEAAVRKAFDTAIQKYGRVDIAVNSAGVRLTGTAVDTSLDEWNTVLGTNLTGAFLVSREAVLRMKTEKGGSIVNISANSGFRGNPGRVAYSASKGAIHNLTEAMAIDHAADRIRVNCVAPGPTATPMMGEITEEQQNRLASRIPLGRVGQPHDIAEAVAFLVSNAAKHITGSIISVAGGAHLQG